MPGSARSPATATRVRGSGGRSAPGYPNAAGAERGLSLQRREVSKRLPCSRCHPSSSPSCSRSGQATKTSWSHTSCSPCQCLEELGRAVGAATAPKASLPPPAPARSSVAQTCPHFRLGKRRPGPRGSEMMPNLLMELDSSGIKSTSEIATPLQSASALEERNQKRNLPAAGRGWGARSHAG